MPQTPAAIQTLTAAGLNLIGQALTIYDNDLRLAVCNARFQSMFDLPDNLVMIGAPFEETIRHLAQRGEYGEVDDVEAFVRERVEQARAFQAHYMERTRATGTIISVEGSPLPQGGWVTVYTDITRTKQQEVLLRARSEELSDQVLAHTEELASTNRALASTVSTLEETKRHLTKIEARTRLTTEMMPAHIAHVDEAGHYTYSNRRLSSVIPNRPSDIVGLHISDALGPTVYSKVRDHLQTAFSGLEAVHEFSDIDSARRIRVAFTPDSNGGAYVLSMDVTQETQARVALQQTRRRTLAAQVTSGMAHDFSNLLTIILGMQSSLARIDGLPKEANALIDATLSAAQRGGQLLSSIAEMTGQPLPNPRATDPHVLLQDLQTLARPSLPSGMTLTVTDLLPDASILLDSGTVQDSLLNLILNARDACQPDGAITLCAETVHDTWVQFTLSDTGAGFSAHALEHACDPFFTTKGKDGSGLGLPMVYDMTKLAGGDLQLGNQSGGGAVVRLRLPLRFSPTGTKGLVLLVEDEDDLRAHYRDLLIGLGHSVVEAISVQEATALIETIPDIQLVLSDIHLSGEGTGLDLMNGLRKTGTPVILMTSLPETDPLHRMACATTLVLHKPFSPADLAAALTPKVAQ
ncbi:PAS-domain containing protein [Pseudosulfitobacter sp. SM2401]|uniref:PAS-domain containing protein n=1 Tax=Pseudosulfitobacter sp. SM2401 TaxID=3350098 RepID=UPI0036F1A039